MFRTVFKSKLHRATVTEANLNYVGSITIDEDLLDAAEICVNEKVQVVNNNNGARLETYAIPGPRGSGVVCLNGAAARLVQPGDKVIIITYAVIDDKEAKAFKPTVVFLDDANRIAEVKDAEKHGEIR
ncbi:MAG: aspartate 1-decarboxylase [Sporomusaceae bacterium]|nr:aspartate 1-decarboxylase [Sporomusaceae bacterium]